MCPYSSPKSTPNTPNWFDTNANRAVGRLAYRDQLQLHLDRPDCFAQAIGRCVWFATPDCGVNASIIGSRLPGLSAFDFSDNLVPLINGEEPKVAQ